MEYILDLKGMIALLKSAETDNADDIIETYGERYIFENIIKNSIANQPIFVGEIDFDEFDENDITAIIEDKFDQIDDRFSALQYILNVFSNMSAKPAKIRKFF